MYTRLLEKKVQEYIGDGKIILIVGARQVGKTTLLKKLFPIARSSNKTVFFGIVNLLI